MENLEHIKKTAADIELKVIESKKTSSEIDKVIPSRRPKWHFYLSRRESFTEAALHELLCFTSSSMIWTGFIPCISSASKPSVLCSTLQSRYSNVLILQLKVFSELQRAAMDKDVAKRVQNLTDSITFMVFQYTTRGLFECDKLIFTAQMAFQVSKLSK